MISDVGGAVLVLSFTYRIVLGQKIWSRTISERAEPLGFRADIRPPESGFQIRPKPSAKFAILNRQQKDRTALQIPPTSARRNTPSPPESSDISAVTAATTRGV